SNPIFLKRFWLCKSTRYVNKFKYIASPIPKDNALAVGHRLAGDDIIRAELDLAATAGQIDHKIGNPHPADPTAQVFNDAQPAAKRGAKMGDPAGHIALKHIIGATAV